MKLGNCDFCGVPGDGPIFGAPVPCRTYTLGMIVNDATTGCLCHQIPDIIMEPRYRDVITVVKPAMVMEKEWFACFDCYGFILADDADGLAKRCADRYVRVMSKKHPGVPADLVTKALKEAHSGFWLHRIVE